MAFPLFPITMRRTQDAGTDTMQIIVTRRNILICDDILTKGDILCQSPGHAAGGACVVCRGAWCLCSSSSMHAATQKVVQWRGYPLYCMTGLTSRLFLSRILAVISPPHAQHDLVPGPSELVCLMGLTLPHVQHVLCLEPLSSVAGKVLPRCCPSLTRSYMLHKSYH